MSWTMHGNSPLPLVGAGERAKQRAPSLQPLSHKWARGFIGVVLFSLFALTAHATDEQSLPQQLAACSLQTDATERLACYDALALNLKMAEKPIGSAGSEPINEDNALFKLSCAYFAKDC